MSLRHAGGFQPGVNDPISLGTTIVSMSYNGGVMLAADSRTSNGNYIANRVQDKITPLADNVYLLRSGSAADTQAIARYVQYFIAQHQSEKGDQVEVETVANLAVQIAYNNKSHLQAGLIVAGVDKANGPSVFAIPLGGTLLKVPFAIGGSGSAYISGFVDKHYRLNMTREECKEFITRAVAYAMARDGSSGGCIRIVTIEESGVVREFVEGNQVPLGFGDMRVQVPAA